MNNIVLIGRLTRDPELRYTQSGKAVASFSLAVDRRGKDKGADFIPCIAWDKLAEVIGNNLAKGRRIGIEGRLQSRTYEAKDGGKRTAYEVILNNMEFLDSNKGKQDNQGNQGEGTYLDDEEIPF